MSKSAKDYLFETYLKEYGKHRDEIQNRIIVQNDMSKRVVFITGLVASLLATVFTISVKIFGGDDTSQNNIQLFYAVCIPILFLYGGLLKMTLANYIYQLCMIFVIARYWNWIVEKKVEPIIGRFTEAFLWDRIKEPPWRSGISNTVLKYFQCGFIYLLCFISLFGFLVALLWKPAGVLFNHKVNWSDRISISGFNTFLVLCDTPEGS